MAQRRRPHPKISRGAISTPAQLLRTVAISATISAATIASLGCYHVISPPKPLDLPSDYLTHLVDTPRTIRILNGYETEAVRWFREEGIHDLGLDLREWTDRLIAELHDELFPRQVSVVYGNTVGSKVRGTLRTWVTEFHPPNADGGGGAWLQARLMSDDGSYIATVDSGETTNDFGSAYYELKKKILEDTAFTAWLRHPVAFPTPTEGP